MDIGYVHQFMRTVQNMDRQSMSFQDNQEHREMLKQIRSKPYLEMVSAKVLVNYPFLEKPTWEEVSPVFDYQQNGDTLVMRRAGFDNDGDWGAIESVGWPGGTWLKVVVGPAELVDNPYFISPVASDDQ